MRANSVLPDVDCSAPAHGFPGCTSKSYRGSHAAGTIGGVLQMTRSQEREQAHQPVDVAKILRRNMALVPALG